MILLLPPLDVTGDMLELSILSDEFLGPSEIGDLMDSLRSCLVNEALIDRGMHFECPEDDSSLSSCGFCSLHVLHILCIGFCYIGRDVMITVFQSNANQNQIQINI